jgi:enolase
MALTIKVKSLMEYNKNGLNNIIDNCLILNHLSSVGKLGANAILGVSLAVCKAGAAHKVF